MSYAGFGNVMADDAGGHRYSLEPGAVGRECSVTVDRVEHPIRVLSSLGIFLQIEPNVASVIARGMELPALFRRLGVGRVRKDGSTPLEPPLHRIAVHDVDAEAALVWNPGEDPATRTVFRLGRLSAATVHLAATFARVSVQIYIATDFLPEARWERSRQLIEQRSAFGAMVGTKAVE